MAVADITQFKETFHVPREAFRTMLITEDLSKTDLRIFCYLMTSINGFNKLRRMGTSREFDDPCNYTKVHISVIAKELGYSEKKVKKSIQNLLDRQLIEKGNSPSVKGGYRFTF